ncbi:GSCOCG00010948001-RA-CDS [Cotesia congregata]|nr:GSCOCG00010948001-RA-CDS [Cotesia congregata]
MLDARLNFKQQVEHVSPKASVVRASLARLMPNVGGLKQSRRLLLSSVGWNKAITLITLSAEKLRAEERQNSIARWQSQWDAATTERWTHRLIPKIDVWLNRSHGEVNYYLTQMLPGHGCFRTYLHRFKHDDSPECSSCPGINEDAEHVFFECPRFYSQPDELEMILKKKIQPETIVEAMMSSEAA